MGQASRHGLRAGTNAPRRRCWRRRAWFLIVWTSTAVIMHMRVSCHGDARSDAKRVLLLRPAGVIK